MNKTIINGIDVSEEIIIDGVNVKDCKRRIGKNSYCRYFKRPCADNNFNCIWKQRERLKEENEKLKAENEQLKKPCLVMPKVKQLAVPIEKYEKLYKAIEEIRNITEKLITETPEYHSCYYKDECGDNCTPKKQSKVEYCCYENVDKILTIINEVLK